MSRSGFSEECDGSYGINPWPAIIARAVQGRPGTKFLRELLAALHAMPVKELVAEALVEPSGAACALGSVALARRLDVSALDPEDYEAVAKAFCITPTLAREIAFINDDDFRNFSRSETPAERWTRVRGWVVKQLELAAIREDKLKKA